MPWKLVSVDTRPVEFKDLEVGENFVHTPVNGTLYRKISTNEDPDSPWVTQTLQGDHRFSLRVNPDDNGWCTYNEATCYRILVVWED